MDNDTLDNMNKGTDNLNLNQEDNINFVSNLMCLDSKKQLKERLDKPKVLKVDDFDDGKFDQKGDDRDWNNWVIKSFIPKPAVDLNQAKGRGGGGFLNPGGMMDMNKSISFVATSKTF